MTITNRLFHRLRPEDLRASNTHCSPQPSVPGRKGPQSVIGIVGPGENIVSSATANLSAARTRGGEFPFDFLIHRELQEQHAEIRRELLRLQELSAQATKQEKAAEGRSAGVGPVLGSLATALAAHIDEEEKIFPFLLKLELAYIGEGPAPSHHKLAREALHTISKEHDHYLRDLQEITRKADSITAADATSPVHDLSARLKTLHRLLLKHCYFETNVVFARAAAMEAELFR